MAAQKFGAMQNLAHWSMAFQALEVERWTMKSVVGHKQTHRHHLAKSASPL